MRTWKELQAELDELLANETDELEQVMLKIKYNALITEAWQQERANKNNKDPYSMVGSKVYAVSGSKHYKRVLHEDGHGLYVKADSGKGYVEYDKCYDNFKITHWVY